MRICVGIGSRGRFPSVVRKESGTAIAGYVLVQRHFEFPDGGKSYLETDDLEFCGHFRIRKRVCQETTSRFRLAKDL